jgi:hypothetical protein
MTSPKTQARARAKELASYAYHTSVGPAVERALEELLLSAVAYHGAKNAEGEPLTRLAMAANDFARALESKS